MSRATTGQDELDYSSDSDIQDELISQLEDTKIQIEEEETPCRCEDNNEDDAMMVDQQKEETMMEVTTPTTPTTPTTMEEGEKKPRTRIVRAKTNCDKCGCCKLVPLEIPMYGPYTLRGILKKGIEYEYCTCGLTKTQPLCDKSHVGTKFQPIKFQVPHNQSIWLLCGCRYTQRPPYCDAEHTHMPMNPTKPPCRCEDDPAKKELMNW
eukprot:gene18243-21828_t